MRRSTGPSPTVTLIVAATLTLASGAWGEGASWRSKDAPTALAAFAEAYDAAVDAGPARRVERLLSEAARGAASPAVRDYAQYLQYEATVRAGQLERAQKQAEALGVVPRAWFIGPFANTGGTQLGTPTPVHGTFAPEQDVPGMSGAVRWQEVDIEPRRAAFNLDAQLVAADEVRGVLAFVLDAKRPTDVALHLASSAQLAVYVNGEARAVDDVERPLTWDQTVVSARLQRGPNLVWIRVGNIRGDFAVRARVRDLSGRPVSGVTASVAPALMKRALAQKPRLGAPAVHGVFSQIRRELDAEQAGELPTDFGRWSRAIALERRFKTADQRAQPPLHREWLLAHTLRLAQVSAPPADEVEILLALAEDIQSTNPSTARAKLERVLSLDGKNAHALLALADLRHEQGYVEAAARLAEQARAAAPTSSGVWRRSAEILRDSEARRLEEDGRVFARAARSDDTELLRLAVEIAEQRGDHARAARFVDKLALIDAGDALVFRHRREALERRLNEQPDDTTAVAALIALHRDHLAQHPASHHVARRLALLLVGSGDVAGAQSVATERRRRYPARAEPLSLAGELALWSGARDDAVRAYRQASLLLPADRTYRALIRRLEAGRADLAKLYPASLDDVATIEAPEGADVVGAYIASETTAIRFFENGLGAVVEDRWVRILDAKKADGWRATRVQYTEGREVAEVLVAERITRGGDVIPPADVFDRGPDGKVNGVYTDSREKVVVFDTLLPGDLVHVRTRKEMVGKQNLFGDFFGHIAVAQLPVPTARWRLVVESPNGRDLFYGGRGVPEPARSERGGFSVYDFRRADVPRVELEEGMPPFMEVADYVSVSTYASWPELGRWYVALIRDQLYLDDELKAIAQKLVEGAASEEEKVRRVYEYVVSSTRYVGIELGIHGWKPYPVTAVHRRRYGDCKDKASLLAALLNEVGVDVRIALVRTAHVGAIEPAPPSMWSFNHAIAYVPGLDLFLDGTAERSGFRELPVMDHGGLSLLVAPFSDAEPKLVTIPIESAESNLNRSEYALVLQPDGALAVTGMERFRGAEAAEQRRSLADAGVRRDRLASQLGRILPGTTVHEVTPTPLGLDVAEVGYDFTATIPGRALKDAGGTMTMALSLYPHDVAGSYARRSTRKQDVWLMKPWRTRNVMRYILPEGISALDLPEGESRIEGPHFRFVQRILRTEDGFIVDEDTAMLSRRIPVADYPAFREQALAADALMKRKVRLAPVGGGA